jgi:hypothetical protein
MKLLLQSSTAAAGSSSESVGGCDSALSLVAPGNSIEVISTVVYHWRWP